MRKFLSIIALVVLTLGLIIGGIMLFTNLKDTSAITQANALQIGGGIAMILGGVCSGIMAIANFFKMKVKDND